LKKAYVLLKVEMGSEKEVLDYFKETPDIKETHQLYGVYDLLIRVETETMQELKDLINNRIKSIGKIRSTTPLICTKW